MLGSRWMKALAGFAAAMPLVAQAPKSVSPLAVLDFLMGEWEGAGTGDPGQGRGGFTFSRDLVDTVRVRKSHADYPAVQDRPASRHEDLMVVFMEGGKVRAHYYDNEGHLIRYEVSGPDAKGAVQFLSEAGVPGPRFRLTYTPTGKASVSLRFEIAPPGTPEAFKTYLEASARRRAPQG